MNEKNYFTIVVPLSPDAQKIVQGNPSAVPLRAAVWSQAAERMKPLLGGVCSRFSPAAAPYGEPLHLPFGVALGGAEAEQFLLCYLVRSGLWMHRLRVPLGELDELWQSVWPQETR